MQIRSGRPDADQRGRPVERTISTERQIVLSGQRVVERDRLPAGVVIMKLLDGLPLVLVRLAGHLAPRVPGHGVGAHRPLGIGAQFRNRITVVVGEIVVLEEILLAHQFPPRLLEGLGVVCQGVSILGKRCRNLAAMATRAVVREGDLASHQGVGIGREIGLAVLSWLAGAFRLLRVRERE